MMGNLHTGSVCEGSYPLLGSRVPLRPGSWTVLAQLRGTNATTLTAKSFLGRIENGRLQEAIDVFTAVNSSDLPERYGCLTLHENELYRSIESNEESGTQSAYMIMNMITWPWISFHDRTTGISDIDSAAAEMMAKLSITFPAEFLLTRFARREPSKFLQVGYFFNPELAGVPVTQGDIPTWRQSEFAPLRIRQDPRKFAFYQAVIESSEQWWPEIKASFSQFRPEGF